MKGKDMIPLYKPFVVAASGLFLGCVQTPQTLTLAPTFRITDFGAVADAGHSNTAAIQKAIDAAAVPGGTVVIPAGTFVTGALFLKPRVNLQLEKDAVLKSSGNLADFPLSSTRIEGHTQEWVPALVNAAGADHLRISGEGTLDGSGQPFWTAFRAARRADGKTKNLDVPRPRMLFIRDSADVKIVGIHLKDSAFWNLHLYRCHDVDVTNVDIKTNPAGGTGSPSTDGIDVDSCQDVRITGCRIEVGDDCIALKGSKGPFAMQDKESPAVEHIRITDCTFAGGGGPSTCGSEATIVRDVVIENCRLTGAGTRGMKLVQLKLRPDTPQLYEDIHFKNITLDGAGALFSVAPWRQYFDLMGQPQPARAVHNVTLENIHGTFGSFGEIAGNPGDVIEGLSLKNVDVKLQSERWHVAGVTNFKIENTTLNGEAITPETFATSRPATLP